MGIPGGGGRWAWDEILKMCPRWLNKEEEEGVKGGSRSWGFDSLL